MVFIEKIHSSAVPSREFQKILSMFCRKYGMYPSFIVVAAPNRNYIKKWGEIPLPRVPKAKFMHPDEKYFLISSLGYHAIMPRNEVNRLLLRSIISNSLMISWKSPLISILSGLFSTIYTFTKTSSDNKFKQLAREALKWICSVLENKRSNLLISEFLYVYYKLLLGIKEESDLLPIAEQVKEIIESKLPVEDKIKFFFVLLRDVIRRDMIRDREFKDFISKHIVSLGSPEVEESEKSWGRNWRSEKKERDISPEELQKIARIDQKNALEIAKELDKKHEKRLKEKKRSKAKKKDRKQGFLPGYSDRLRMFQKLLNQRRYIAAVRRVRLEKILASISMRPSGKHALAIRGQTTWVLGDDEEELNIEMTAETFGHAIPNLTTLKNLYEEDSEGLKKRGISHFEIVIDTSGSMNGQPLETAIDIAIALIEKARRDENSVALVTFSSGAWEGFAPSFEYDALEDVVLRLMADGGTNLRGTLSIIDSHISKILGLSAIFILTDTAIWDINKSEVRGKLLEWGNKYLVYIIAITDELYEETKLALQNSQIRLLRIPPSQETPWNIVLDNFELL